MKILQINTIGNVGSTGRIAEEIGKLLVAQGHKSYIAFGRKNRESQSEKITIGTKNDFYAHVLKTRLSDRHGFGSRKATKILLKTVHEIKPDIIHLHNLHGYYINIKVLFEFIKSNNKPIVWTFHDCWPFTGHCTHFEDIGCNKWKSECHHCPKTKKYPSSWLDNSLENYIDKKRLFTASDLHIVVPSVWLCNLVKQSFMMNFPTAVIYNGIDVNIFKPCGTDSLLDKYSLRGKKIILGVASAWQVSKGINDFVKLSKLISDEYRIVLVGISARQSQSLPINILGINKTESTVELANWYSIATAFVNPTYLDNFPTTNIEALACGTPIITYLTGGSPEAVTEDTGFILAQGDIAGIWKAVQQIEIKGKTHYLEKCRERALTYFNKIDRFQEYLDLYKRLLDTPS